MIESDSLSEVDHIFSKLYHYLWSATEFTLDKFAKIKVRIPDTVIFKNCQPRFWYFTDSEGLLKKKNRENHHPDMITKEFLRKKRKSDIVAYFIKEKLSSDGALPFQRDSARRQEIIYLNEDNFRDFMESNFGNFPDGILQLFIEPPDEWNTLIETVWSKSVCVFTKRRNRKKLNNTKLDLFERCCTFDGPEHFSEKVQMRGGITGIIAETCNDIIKHIETLSYGRFVISRLCVYFKQDASGTPYLLWGSSIRMRHAGKFPVNDKHFNVKPLSLGKKLEIPDNINILTSVNLQKPLQLQKTMVCYDCEKQELPQSFSAVPFSLIIDYKLQEDKSSLKVDDIEGPDFCKADSVKFLRTRRHSNTIPPILRKLFPRMGFEEYAKLINDPEFRNRVTVVCDSCYLRYSAAVVKVDVQKIKPKELQFKGTESLLCTQTDKIKLDVSKQNRTDSKKFLTDLITKCRKDGSNTSASSLQLQGSVRPRTSGGGSTIFASKISSASNHETSLKMGSAKSPSQILKISLETNDLPKMGSELGSVTTNVPDDEREIDNEQKYTLSVNRNELLERYRNQRQLKMFLSQDSRNILKQFHELYHENNLNFPVSRPLKKRNLASAHQNIRRSLKGLSTQHTQHFGKMDNLVDCYSPSEVANLKNSLNECLHNRRSMTSSSAHRPKLAFM